MAQDDWRAVAAQQHGVIAWRQLRAAGVSKNGISLLCKSGRLVRVARCVYSLPASSDSWERDLWVAVLRAGEPAVVSHRSAAAVHGLDAFKPGPVEITVPRSRRPRLTDVERVDRVSRSRSTGSERLQVIRGLPVTSVTDTLIDLGFGVDPDRLERAMECGLRDERTTEALLATALERRSPGRRNALREVLRRRRPGVPATASDAETLFLQLTRRAGLPDPERQFPLSFGRNHYRLDFAWPTRRLAVEVDGAETHANAKALVRDLRRQNRIVMGWLLQRYTWNDIVLSADQVIDVLRDVWALLLRGPMPPSTWDSASFGPAPAEVRTGWRD